MSEVVCEVLCGDFSSDDAPRSGRPAEGDSDQIETLIENNQRYTVQETANILRISKSIKLLVNMKNVSFILRKKPCRLFGQPNVNGWMDGRMGGWMDGSLLLGAFACVPAHWLPP